MLDAVGFSTISMLTTTRCPLPPNSVEGGSTVTCTVGKLAVGKAATFSFSVRLNTSVPAGSDITNCVAVSSDDTQVTQQPYLSCVQTQIVSVA